MGRTTHHTLAEAQPHATYIVLSLREVSEKEKELLASVGVVEGVAIQVDRRLPGGTLLIATADSIFCVAFPLAKKILVSPHANKTAMDV